MDSQVTAHRLLSLRFESIHDVVDKLKPDDSFGHLDDRGDTFHRRVYVAQFVKISVERDFLFSTRQFKNS